VRSAGNRQVASARRSTIGPARSTASGRGLLMLLGGALSGVDGFRLRRVLRSGVSWLQLAPRGAARLGGAAGSRGAPGTGCALPVALGRRTSSSTWTPAPSSDTSRSGTHSTRGSSRVLRGPCRRAVCRLGGSSPLDAGHPRSGPNLLRACPSTSPAKRAGPFRSRKAATPNSRRSDLKGRRHC
jgi:hypothetical protein